MKRASWEPVFRFAADTRSFWTARISDREERKSAYSKYSETLPTHPEVVFYESMSGARMMDSPFSIFASLVKRPIEGPPLLHVWSVRSMDIVPPEWQDRPDTIFVTRHTHAYMYLLARAKYVIGNSVLPEYFVRKPDQLYLNTWHGVGYKTLGRTTDSPLGAALAVSNMLQSTHVISPCAFMTEVHQRGFSMLGTYTGELAEVGYPRVDTTLASAPEEIDVLRSSLGVNPGRRTVLYAPTWRGSGDDSRFDTQRLESDLRRLVEIGLNVIFLGHHIMGRHVSNLSVPRLIVPPANANTNRLLAAADILITDYSSIFFDFMATRRPIIHYLYDYEDYKRERGLALSLDALPGVIAYDSDELISATKRFAKQEVFLPDDRYLGASARFCPYDDGKSTKRVIDWFFNGKTSEVRLIANTRKKRVCFWGGRMVDSSETDAFMERLRTRVAEGDAHVVLFVAHGSTKNAAFRRLLSEIGDKIAVIARAGYAFGMTADEARAREQLSSASLPETRDLYHQIYRREYRRTFGDTRFDEIVLADGLSKFWLELSKYGYK